MASQTDIIPESVLFLCDDGELQDYKCGKGNMTQDKMTTWFENVLPLLPANSLALFDNASVHNKTIEGWLPRGRYVKKQEYIDWLREHTDVDADDLSRMKVPQLKELVNKHKPATIYEIDRLLIANGHTPVRTPPYHPEYQPMELIWGHLKRSVYGSYSGDWNHLKSTVATEISSLSSDLLCSFWFHCQKVILNHFQTISQGDSIVFASSDDDESSDDSGTDEE